MFVCAVTFPIVFLSLNPNPAMLITIMAAGFSVATFGATMIMFGPKTALLWEGADVDENFGIVRSDNTTSNATNALHQLKTAVKNKVRSGGSAPPSATISKVIGTVFEGKNMPAALEEHLLPANGEKLQNHNIEHEDHHTDDSNNHTM